MNSATASDPMPPPEISLNLMPAFYRKHLGLEYGEAYYFDPAQRAAIERAEGRFLNEILGRYGVGSPEPAPSPGLMIQPIDMLKATQGARVVCPVDATLETHGHPWAGLDPAAVARIDPAAAANHPFIDALVAQYEELSARYGDAADVQGVKSGTMVIHGPYTTAHQLCGEDLFCLLIEDPAGARLIFATICSLYEAIFARLRRVAGAPPPTALHIGDCSASLLSPDLYRRVVLPHNLAAARGFNRLYYHSCGPSSHLLDSFSALPCLGAAELGPGTDLEQAAAVLPQVSLRPLVDPLIVRDGTPERVGETVRAMAAACASAPETTLCAWSFDRETPCENLDALYAAVAAVN